MSLKNTDKKLKGLRVLRWTIRGLGLLFVLPNIVLAITEGLPSFTPQNLTDFSDIIDYKISYISLFLIWIGVFAGIWKEWIGGVLVLIGSITVMIIEKNVFLGGVFFIYLIISIGYLFVWYEDWKLKIKK